MSNNKAEHTSILLIDEDNTYNIDDYYATAGENEPICGSFMDCMGKFLGCMCMPVNCCGCCCNAYYDGCCFNPYRIIKRGYKGIVTRFGSVKEIVTDGLHYVNPLTENIVPIDMMLHTKKLKNQSVITKDKLPITIDGCVYYKINNSNTDIIRAKYGIANINISVEELAHSTLRLVLGKHTLQECLEKRNEFAKDIKTLVDNQAKNWGLIIEDIQIIDIVIPQHIQNLLSTGAIAEQEAKAQIITAEAAVKSAHLMREAADQLNTPAAMQMRTLDTYKILAESENSKLIFLPACTNNFVDTLSANVVANHTMNNSN